MRVGLNYSDQSTSFTYEMYFLGKELRHGRVPQFKSYKVTSSTLVNKDLVFIAWLKDFVVAVVAGVALTFCI